VPDTEGPSQKGWRMTGRGSWASEEDLRGNWGKEAKDELQMHNRKEKWGEVRSLKSNRGEHSFGGGKILVTGEFLLVTKEPKLEKGRDN